MRAGAASPKFKIKGESEIQTRVSRLPAKHASDYKSYERELSKTGWCIGQHILPVMWEIWVQIPDSPLIYFTLII